MAYIKSFAVMLITLSVFLGIIRFLFPKGALSSPLKLLCGLIALVTLMSPMGHLFEDFSGYNVNEAVAAAVSYDVSGSEDIYIRQVMRQTETGISEDVRAYLLDKNGVSAVFTDAKVSVNDLDELSVDYIDIGVSSEEEKMKININDLKERYMAEDVFIKVVEA